MGQQYQFTFVYYDGVPEIHMDYGGLPQLHWQGLVSWEVRREQIAQARARNPTNLKSKSPPNLKSKNLNLIYKNIANGPIIEKEGKLQASFLTDPNPKANTWQIWFWLQCRTTSIFPISSIHHSLSPDKCFLKSLHGFLPSLLARFLQ